MKTVLIATEKPFTKESREDAVQIMQKAGLDVKILENYKRDSEELTNALKGVNGVIVRSDKITKEIIDSTPDLKLIVRGGAGLNDIACDYAEKKGITVENTPGMNSNAVAEIALQMILNSTRPLNGKTGNEIGGKILGIHGFGSIGQIVSKLARAYDMDVKVYDKFLNQEKAKNLDVKIVDSLSELYKNSDFISVHIPKTDETQNSINYSLLSLMSKKGILINTARAEVIDEKSLIKILEERKNFKYATDVYPSKDTQKILENGFNDRVIITPKKQGAQTEEANYSTAIAAAKQSVEFFVNGVILNSATNPLPTGKKDFAVLAKYLGLFNRAFIENPVKIQVICYNELNKYKKQLAQYVLKGLFQGYLENDLTPSQLQKEAKIKGIELKFPKPKNHKGHGNSITIDYFTKNGNSHSIRGRVDERELQINRVGEFKTHIPLIKSPYILVQYDDQMGMFEKFGKVFTNEGYNKVFGSYRRNDTGRKVFAFTTVEKKDLNIKTLRNTVYQNINKMGLIDYAHLIDLR